MNSNHLIQSNPYVAVLLQIQAIEGNMIRTHQEHIFSIGRLLLGSSREGGKPITPNASRIDVTNLCWVSSVFFCSTALWYTFGSKFRTSVPGLVLSVSWLRLCHWMKLGKADVSTCPTDRPTYLGFLGPTKNPLWGTMAIVAGQGPEDMKLTVQTLVHLKNATQSVGGGSD